jgi:hypothetical protein
LWIWLAGGPTPSPQVPSLPPCSGPVKEWPSLMGPLMSSTELSHTHLSLLQRIETSDVMTPTFSPPDTSFSPWSAQGLPT